jgi:hypothetical protein
MTATLGAAVCLQIQVLFIVQRASSSPLSALSANQRFCMSDRGEFWHKLNYLAYDCHLMGEIFLSRFF